MLMSDTLPFHWSESQELVTFAFEIFLFDFVVGLILPPSLFTPDNQPVVTRNKIKIKNYFQMLTHNELINLGCDFNLLTLHNI